ncbi:hypothetical protein N0V86_000566 [Didymella sp. IMI 355093]|nr:hypothetical protein N0V86_000566 [Didymella sp. IMI 355093]
MILVKSAFFSLTRVCRQIRAEFLPVYMERTQIAIDVYDLDEGYIPTFLTPSGTKNEDAAGDLVIAMFVADEACYYDVTPIIRLAQQAKRLRVTIAYSKDYLSSHGYDFLTLANKFFDPAGAPLLHEYLQGQVEKIKLFVDDGLPSIFFQLYLRKGFYEQDWMDEWDYRYKCFADPISGDTGKSLGRWGKERGLEIDSGYRDVGWFIGFHRSFTV